jgi:hypothetical protein
MEGNRKSLELVLVMDVHELHIATKHAKHFEKENEDLDTKLCSQVDDLGKSLKPSNVWNLVSKSCPTMFPSFKNNSKTCKCKSSCSHKKLKKQIISSTEWLSWR